MRHRADQVAECRLEGGATKREKQATGHVGTSQGREGAAAGQSSRRRGCRLEGGATKRQKQDPPLKTKGGAPAKAKKSKSLAHGPRRIRSGWTFLTDESERRKANPSVFVMRQKRRDDSVDREKLILLVTFRGRGPLASDNPIRPRLIRSGWTFLTGES